MAKLVVLKLSGNLESGFEVGLELGEDGQLPDLKLYGKLPANRQLAARSRQHWDETYRDLGQTYRIKQPEVFYGGHVNRRIEECKQSAKQLETDFNRWLKSPSFQRIREEWRGFVSRPEEVRVLVQTQDPMVEKLPWHEWDLLKRDYEKGEIGLGYWEYRRREGRSSVAREKVRVLAIFGSSEGIDIQTDRQLLAQLGDRAEIDIFIEPQRQQINDRLWEQHWDIIFFAGHSETQGNEGRLYLNANDSLTLGELWYGLRTAAKNGLQLAIFNSCDGLGLARSLDDILIPQVIVMRERVPDPVAQAFLRYFLRAFASGKSLYLSVREAREQLQGLEKDFPCATWLPVIYQSPAQVPLSWEEYLRSPAADISVSDGAQQTTIDPSPRRFGTVGKTATIAALCGLGAIAYPAAKRSPIPRLSTPSAYISIDWGRKISWLSDSIGRDSILNCPCGWGQTNREYSITSAMSTCEWESSILPERSSTNPNSSAIRGGATTKRFSTFWRETTNEQTSCCAAVWEQCSKPKASWESI